MAKLTREQRIEMYAQYKAGKSISQIAREYQVNNNNVKYLIRLLNYHGIAVLDKKYKRYYDPKMKQQIIDEVLVHGKSIGCTAVEYGLLSRGMLGNWIKQYKTF